MKKNLFRENILFLFFIFLVLFTAAAAAQANPVPVVTSISPDHKVQHMPAFILTVNGSNFVPDSSIVFDGQVKTTAYISDTELQCIVFANNILVPAGNPNHTVSVKVWNPAPGGGASQPVDFLIYAEHAFTGVIDISGTADRSLHPWAAVDQSDVVHVAWDEIVEDIYKIYYRRSTNFGGTWDPIRVLSEGMENRHVLSINVPANTNGLIYVFFYTYDSGIKKLYYSLSSDSGVTWGQPNLIRECSGCSTPLVRTDDNGNFLLLQERLNGTIYDVYFARSTDRGATWPIITNVSNSFVDSRYPAFDVGANGNIHIAWSEDPSGADEVYYSRSSDNGATFSAPLAIANSQNNFEIEVEADSLGEVYLFWVTTSQGPPFTNTFYMSYSTNGGTTFSPGGPQWGYQYWWDTSVCVDRAGNINYLDSWYDLAISCNCVSYNRSMDYGANWDSFSILSPVTVDTSYVEIVTDRAGNVYTLWYGYDFQNACYQIYLCRTEH